MLFGSVRSRGQAPVVVNAQNQFKEVNDYFGNIRDVMGFNSTYWCLPCAARDPKDPLGYDQPGIDGVSWHII